jgi:hypothetical protein
LTNIFSSGRQAQDGLATTLSHLSSKSLSALPFSKSVSCGTSQSRIMSDGSSQVPTHFRKLRYTVYSMMVIIASLGITLTMGWIFQCTPFLSNFVFSIDSTSCVNYDYFRWSTYTTTFSSKYKLTRTAWIGLGLPIDGLILAVPLQILKRTLLKSHERKILRWVFSANLLGTVAL